MADSFDRQQLMQFLKRTAEELKRTGEELKVEASRLLEEVRDPARQTKLKARLLDLRHWAEETGKEAGEIIEVAVRRVEQHFDKSAPAPEPAAAARTATPAREEPAAPARAARPASKSVGKAKKKAVPTAPPAPAKKAPAKKTVGKKPSRGK